MARINGGIIGPDNIPSGPLGSASGVWKLSDAFNYQKEGLWPVVTGITYPVANSLRFNSASSDYLSRSASSTTSITEGTISAWVKRSTTGSNHTIFNSSYQDGSTYYFRIFINSSDQLEIENKDGSTNLLYRTNQVFRDVSSFYHILVRLSLTESGNNRVKVYVNGEQVTSFATQTAMTGDQFLIGKNNYTVKIGNTNSGTSNYWNGYMSDVYGIYGTALTPTSFGETDSVSGNWKAKAYSGNYAANSFFLQFNNSGALGTDSSGQSSTFTVNNLTSVDQSTDTPTTVYATYNPLGNFFPADTFSNGNLTQTTNSGNYTYNISTLGASNGKYYCEIKNSTNNNNSIGIADRPSISTTNGLTGTTYGWAYVMSGQVYNNGSIVATYNTVTTNDIVGIALDLDNNKVYFSKNGTWQGSSDPSAGTGGISITAPASNRTGFYFFGSGDEATNSAVHNANFGSPPYAANGYADGNGFGDFSYAVPTGYYALNTQNLNFQG